MNSTGSGYDPVVVCSEQSIESWDTITGAEFLD
jgi:hypothetical protein